MSVYNIKRTWSPFLPFSFCLVFDFLVTFSVNRHSLSRKLAWTTSLTSRWWTAMRMNRVLHVIALAFLRLLCMSTLWPVGTSQTLEPVCTPTLSLSFSGCGVCLRMLLPVYATQRSCHSPISSFQLTCCSIISCKRICYHLWLAHTQLLIKRNKKCIHFQDQVLQVFSPDLLECKSDTQPWVHKREDGKVRREREQERERRDTEEREGKRA